MASGFADKMVATTPFPDLRLRGARRMGLSLPGLTLANQLHLALQAQGRGSDGTQALELALARLSGIDWEAR